MARADKVAVVDRVTEQFSEAAATLLTDYRGLTVEELAELRAQLREVDASYNVVKNTLTRIAAKNAGLEGMDDMLTGPTALVFCGTDPVGPAKALKAFGKDHEALVIKGGYLDGNVLDAEAALKLADLESREDLLAKLAGMMNNALAGFARLLQAPIADMARLMAALETDGGAEAKGFSPTAAAAPAAEAADDSDESADSPASVDSPESDDSDDAPAAAEVAEDAAAATAEVADDAAEAVADAAEAAADAAPDAVAETAEDAAEAVADAAESAAEAVAEVAEEAAEAVADATEDAADEDATDEEE